MPSLYVIPRRPGRPPKVCASRLETREALIRYGTEILTEKGFHSTGIDEVLKHVGVPKGSFYHYFASKDEFGYAIIDNYAAYFARKLDRWLLAAHRSPLERIADFVSDAKAGMERHAFRRGCLVGNMGQELGALHEGFRMRLGSVFGDWQERMARCFEAARDAGEISPDADCRRLAAFFWIGWEGAVLQAKLCRSTAPLELFAESFFAGLPRRTFTAVQSIGRIHRTKER
ncbi:MAG: acrylate utilization transcriptional regulator AcuR [Desulfobacteria bacterium]|nr:TetR/AcrR family transcriptional regulator [Deltaproteobacteria bacterium]OYV99109.1 MAG: TetR family transcriptional regulator [Deltaproteobacteria bacterium 37-65-8]HQT97103.1 TetR/AcrR family transcriptional regulator [Thermodesulfobacteriota bacterium]